MSCVWLAEVLAEKVIKLERYSADMPLSSLSDVVRVLPVPVGPTHITYAGVGTGRWLIQVSPL